MKLVDLLSLCAVAAVSTVTFAQAPAPAPAAAAPVAAAAAPVPPSTVSGCDKPAAYPGNSASEGIRRAWQKSLDAYGACVRKFSDDQRIIAETAIRSGNEAVGEYNAVVQTAREEIAKPKS